MLDTILLGAFIYMMIKIDLFVVFAGLLGMLLVLGGSWWYQRSRSSGNEQACPGLPGVTQGDCTGTTFMGWSCKAHRCGVYSVA